MSLNFNASPYYDDFDPSKNYHRILFKPGFAVQARELTQAQSILQDQVTKFADNIFKQNSPVTGGQVTTNLNCNYIKLQTTYNNSAIDVSQFLGKLIQDATGTVFARVIAVANATGTEGVGDPPTLIVSYTSGNKFSDNSVVYDSATNLAAKSIVANSTGVSSVVSIAQGVFYISSNYTRADGIKISNGTFVQVNPQTTILSKYNSTPSVRVGLNISESIQTYAGDTSLLDPAVGASNYQAPGADRYQITLSLETRPLTLGDDDTFIELVRITNGGVAKLIDESVYNVIDDYFAKRDYETNGDYVVNDFKLTPKTNLDDAANNTYIMSIGKGLAYVRGYRIENQAQIDLISDRSKTTAAQNNNPIFLNYGSYFYVNTVRGANGSFFDVTTTQQIDLHCVPVANVSVASANAYNSTVVGSGYIRNLIYDNNTSDSAANSYVYKAYVYNIQNNVLTGNAVSATANTITLPSTFSAANSAYNGVNISITSGTDAGDFKTITAYNGVTKVATLNSNWIATPDTTSNFALNFDIKDSSILMSATKATYPATITSTAIIDPSSRVGGISAGATVLQNPTTPELIFPIGNPYTASLSGTSYTTTQLFRGIVFGGSGTVSATLSYSGYSGAVRHFGTVNSVMPTSLVKQNYTIIVTDKGTSSLNVGDLVNWTTAGRTISLNGDGSVATLSASDAGGTFTATIVATVFASTGDDTSRILKIKNLITANATVVNMSGTQVNTYSFVDNSALTSTGQVYIQNAGIVSFGSKQSLYLTDVKNIVKIIDTGAAGTTANVAMLTNSAYDITRNYTLDNGQRDNFYDHASITLRAGSPKPKGNILVLVNYYQHSGGDGYFSKMSYIDNSTQKENYTQIPLYSSSRGTLYNLRDCVDFRPSRLNAQTAFVFRYSSSATNYGKYLPIDAGLFTGDYSYFLGRKDILVLTKDKSFNIVKGAPAIQPLAPSVPDGSLLIANMKLDPYTAYLPSEISNPGILPNLSIDKIQHKRYTMQDISGLENRINQVEYYSALNALELNAQSLQIPDALGLNRFKNGILVDDFSSYAAADTSNKDYFANINKRTRQLTAAQSVDNFPLKSLLLAYNMGSFSPSIASAQDIAIGQDGMINYFTLPYTSANVITQPLASRVVNSNTFATPVAEGVSSLTPNVDNWVDKSYSPSLLITNPNMQVFNASKSINILSVGDWQTISSTSSSVSETSSSSSSTQTENHQGQDWGFGTDVGVQVDTSSSTTTTWTTTNLFQQQNNVLGPYSSIGNTYALNNGYITDISVLPWIRPQQLVTRSKGLLLNATLNAYFDGISVSKYVRNPNTIELTNVSLANGGFNENDTVGYYVSGAFVPTARVIGVYNYPNSYNASTNVINTRLYVGGDGRANTYSTTGVLQNAFFDASGNYQANTAAGTITSNKHVAAIVNNVSGNTITLSALSSNTTNYYAGNTINIVAGAGVGKSYTISSYNAATKSVTVSSPTVACANGDFYSIGTFNTDESGSFYGVFNIPPNTFHTGERVFRIDNSVNNIPNTATTFTQSTFYASGLSTQSQNIDFGASPAGAKNTFIQTNHQTVTFVTVSSSTSSTSSMSPYDPVAQTFSVDVANYPNGLFLNSLDLFFKSKPLIDNSSVTLYIVGTLNGYPNGTTLDHSIVTMTPEMVKVSDAPHYLDSTAATKFQFKTPVYIQPGVLYSLIIKSSSTEYNLWTAANGDAAVPSSVKNLPTDATPTTITKISSPPYVGSLFVSQNAQTWSADQNQSLMFVLNRCVFDTSKSPNIQFVVPNGLPQRSLIDDTITYFNAANLVSNTISTLTSNNIIVDAFNVTTTDFLPSTTNIGYAYNSTLLSGGAAGLKNINPGKFGTSMVDNIYLSDGQGERTLVANSNTSFSLYTQLSSIDPAVSPMISDAGLSVYTVRWLINNCELSNSLISIANTGTGYANGTTSNVVVSAPTGKNGVQAYAEANVVNGNVTSVYFTSNGSGYITTPTITILGSNTSKANVIITGETSRSGGPASTKYLTKKVVLNAGFDSGDLNVYVTAYRPVNTDILVYYKILNRNDTQIFDDGQWQLMTKTNSSDSAYSQTRSNLYEYTFAPGNSEMDQGYISYTSTNGQTYTSFSQFAIKIVLTSTDHTYTPFLTDLRCIALPAAVNTSV
jgi:hypothetical protein